MKVSNYRDWLIESKMKVSDYRKALLEDVNMLKVYASDWLVFSREDEYLVGEDSKRVKYYFVIDSEDDLNGKRLRYVWNIEEHKKQFAIKSLKEKVNKIGKIDWYGKKYMSDEDIKETCLELLKYVE